MSESTWHRVDEVPDEGRVRTAIVDGRSVALTRCGGRVGALDNHCPHQGGPLGEGSIENGWLRCPWHGYDYDPTTGRPPAGFSDAPVAYPVEERADGTYVELPDGPGAPAHGVGRAGRDARRVGRRHGLRHGRALQPRVRRGAAPGRGTRRAALRRDPARGRRRVRRVGLRQAHRPTRRVLRDRRAGLDQPAHRAVRRQARRRAGDRDLRPGAVEGAGPGRVPGPRPRRRSSATSRSPR